MTTNQEGRHAAARTIAGTSGTYNEDMLAMFQAEGATSNNFNEAFIQWLQVKTGSSDTNLNGLQALYATQNGFDRWSSVDSFTTSLGDLYIIAGQSNAVGQGLISDLPSSLSDAISGAKIWNGSSFATLDAGVNNEGDTASEHGPELSFAASLLDADIGGKSEIFIVKYAANGSDMHTEWQKGGTHYDALIAKLQAAGYESYTLGGLLFYQGEADTDSDVHAAAYQANYAQFKSDLRSDLNAPNLRIADVQINIESQPARTSTINTAKRTLAAADSNMFVVKGWVNTSIDATHADSFRQVTIGRDAAYKLAGVTQPLIHLVQTGTVEISDADTSANITVPIPVNPDYTRILFHHAEMDSNLDDRGVFMDLAFDTRTVSPDDVGGLVIATVGSGPDAGSTATGQWTLVEYNPDYVVEVQRGGISVTGTSGTDTLERAIVTANSSLELASFSCASAVENRVFGHVDITNTTTITATRLGSTSSTTYRYNLVEWEPSVVMEGKEDFSIAIGSGSASNTATISSVSTGNTETFWRGMTITSSTAYDDFMAGVELTNATTVTATRDESSTVTTTVYGTAMEYVDGLVTVQRGTATIAASGTTGTDTITSVDTTKAYLNYLWFVSGPHGGNEGEAHVRGELENATTVRATRGLTSSTESVMYHEVIEST